jgi:hypothetical protein
MLSKKSRRAPDFSRKMRANTIMPVRESIGIATAVAKTVIDYR